MWQVIWWSILNLIKKMYHFWKWQNIIFNISFYNIKLNLNIHHGLYWVCRIYFGRFICREGVRGAIKRLLGISRVELGQWLEHLRPASSVKLPALTPPPLFSTPSDLSLCISFSIPLYIFDCFLMDS